MAHAAMVDSYVRELLGELFGELAGDGQGGYLIPLPEGQRVRVVRASGVWLRVLADAVVLDGVEPSGELFGALNAVNAELPYGRVFWADGQVVVEHTVLGDGVDQGQLDNAIRFAGWVVSEYGPDLAHRFGGSSSAHPQPHLPGTTDDDPVVLDPAVRPVGRATSAGREAGTVVVNAAGYL